MLKLSLLNQGGRAEMIGGRMPSNKTLDDMRSYKSYDDYRDRIRD